MGDEREQVIPLREEHVSVGKRSVERGRVRVDVHVREREEPVEQILERRDVEVERVPVGRPVDAMPEPRQEGDVFIIPVVEEEVVISKRLILREEIHVRSRTTERTERYSVKLRSEEADVTRIEAPEDHSNASGEHDV